MEVHQEQLSDVARFIENHKHVTLEDERSSIESILDNIKRFKPLHADSRILEIGVGNGWLQVYCRQQGWNIRGLEISPQMLEFARETGRRSGVELDLELGNIEENEIGTELYDVVIASSVFEHVEHWRDALKKVYRALKPDGLFYFDSTNKFSFTSGEYDFPLYGWLPDQMRYSLRKARQGEDIMKLGIDFNQFRYPLLRRAFRQTGFSQVHDLVELKDAANLRSGSALKRIALQTLKQAKPLKHVALNFVPATVFICIK